MKITEKELHNLINECVQEVLLEEWNNPFTNMKNRLKGWGKNAQQDINTGIQAATDIYNDTKEKVNTKIDNIKQGYNTRKERANTYANEMGQSQTFANHQKTINKIIPTLKTLQETLAKDKSLTNRQKSYLKMGITWLNKFMSALEEQVVAHENNANSLYNTNNGNSNVNTYKTANESIKRLDRIIAEAIKRNVE